MIKEEYKQWIVELKGKIRSAQAKVALSVNQELILLYWDLGKMISAKENVWGSRLMETLSKDLKLEFPDMGGFSVTNLRYCKLFFNYFTIHSQVGNEFHQQLVDEIQISKNQLSTIHPQLVDELGKQNTV